MCESLERRYCIIYFIIIITHMFSTNVNVCSEFLQNSFSNNTIRTSNVVSANVVRVELSGGFRRKQPGPC